MASSSKQLGLIVMQFLKEEKFEEAAHMLEQETGLFFDLKYFERLMIAGEFDQVDRYLAGFMNLKEDRYSLKIFFEIRKMKYLEALDRKDSSKAVEILSNELKVFKEFNPEVYAELMDLLTLDDFRENEQLKGYSRDTKAQRALTFLNIKKLIEANPLIRHKLIFPSIDNSSLRVLINHSNNLQQGHCTPPRSNQDIRNIFVTRDGARTPSPANNPVIGTTPNGVAFLPNPTTYSPFQPGVTPPVTTLTEWTVNINLPVPPAAVASGSAAAVSTPNTDAFLKRPRNPPPIKVGTDHHFADSEHIMKRFRVLNSVPTHSHDTYSESDIPKTVVRSLNQGSNVVSMDFHPQKQTILLVGTDIGDIGIWEVASCERLAHKPLRVWDASKRKMAVQASLSKDSTVSVNKCIWSQDGTRVGVVFSNGIVQMYLSSETGELRQHLQIDAHTGSVNDIAFAIHSKQMYVITCGDDKAIKVWDANSGDIRYTFEGHEAPVHSVCPHRKENIPFIFSTSLDGKIKCWFYDRPRPEISYDAPGQGCTTMAYSGDGLRLFSCGTSKGESYMVEWNDQEGIVKRTYSGLGKRSLEEVKFDTAKNKLLAAGDEYQIKFWDIDNSNILSIAKAEGGLPARPNLRFNKEGSMLAVTTANNGIKVLANPDGIQFLQMLENRRVPQESVVTKASSADLFDAVNAVGSVPGAPENSERVPPEALINNVHGNGMVDFKQKIPDEGANKSKKSAFTEVTDPVQCRFIRLPDPLSTGKIVKLHYARLGTWLLALDTDGKHKLWKWNRGIWNPSGKATAKFTPELWQPADGIDMRNDTSDRDRGEVDPSCMALTKNSSYVMSCSGGKVSLFNMVTFKIMSQFLPSPPAATFLAFHPKDSNITVIGMEDATIQIYNCQTDEIKGTLKGHQKGITGLAFSQVLNVLVSSGADAQLCVWGLNEWEKQKSTVVLSKAGRSPSSLADTRVQFHNDQVHLLVVQDSQIAIYDAYKLECLCHWAHQDPMTASISSATYSCDSLLVYASFCDGSVIVFDAEVLKPRCRIAPSAFMPGISSGNTYPLVIAAHPLQPNQFSLGMTDGSVHLIEPAESDGKWGVVPSDKGAASSNDTISNKVLNCLQSIIEMEK